MRFAILFILSITVLFAGDQTAPTLPPDVQKVVDERQAVVDKAKAVYDAAQAKATSDAIAKLEKVVKDTTKKGDLAGALAAQKVVDELKATITADLLGSTAKEPSNEFVGKWTISALKHGGTVLNFKADKSVDFGERSNWGAWSIEEDGTLKVSWKSGTTYKVTKKGNDLNFVESKGDVVLADGKLVR